MRRKVFNFATAASLVMCVATVTALAISYIGDGVSYSVGHNYSLSFYQGSVSLLRFSTRRGPGTMEIGIFIDSLFSVPLWGILVVTAILPVVWVRKGRLNRQGLCPNCGYSLTGNTSGICPECGTPVPKEPVEKSPRTV